MNERRSETGATRRAVLATAGALSLSAVAGCVEPGGSPNTIAGRSSGNPIDTDERADGSVYTDVYERVIDSVALVHVTGTSGPETDGSEGEGGDEGEETAGQGSAFVVDENHLVTNEHVVWESDTIAVQYTEGDWSDAEVVGSDVYSDLAVLSVDHQPEGATPLSFAEELPTTGQEVLTVGNPFGLSGSMSTGVISGVNRSLPGPDDETGRFDLPNVIQTDAAVNPGNSGGPLVDMNGAVAGVINAGASATIGFAISSALARRVVPALIDRGEYEHSRLGIGFREVVPAVAEANGLDEAAGILVLSVDGPADGVLQASDDTAEVGGESVPVGGDVIVEVAGRPTPDQHALSKVLALETSPGDEIDVVVLRDGSETTVQLTLGARPVDPSRPY